MSEHSMFILSSGQDTWAECECGWASGGCETAVKASLMWSDHMRQESARETLHRLTEADK